MVMADRGFTISDSVGLKQAKLTIPAFTEGKYPHDSNLTINVMLETLLHIKRLVSLANGPQIAFTQSLTLVCILFLPLTT